MLGILRDGGYAEYATLRGESLVRVPDGMDPSEAGVTVFSKPLVLNHTNV